MALPADIASEEFCDLVTTGRASGQPRQVEMWFAADPERDRIYLLSGGRARAHWVQNARRDGRVRVRIGDRWFDGDATEIEGGPDDGHARGLLAAKYQGWTEGRALSGWARESLPVAIDLRPAASTDRVGEAVKR